MGTLTNQAPSSGSGPSIFPVLQKLFFFFGRGTIDTSPTLVPTKEISSNLKSEA